MHAHDRCLAGLQFPEALIFENCTCCVYEDSSNVYQRVPRCGITIAEIRVSRIGCSCIGTKINDKCSPDGQLDLENLSCQRFDWMLETSSRRHVIS